MVFHSYVISVFEALCQRGIFLLCKHFTLIGLHNEISLSPSMAIQSCVNSLGVISNAWVNYLLGFEVFNISFVLVAV